MKISKMVAVIALVVSSGANAALIGRLAATEGGTDYQAYYDDEANLTWLADAAVRGATWDNANSWAAGFVVDGIDGWRLPDTLQPDASCSDQNNSLGSIGYNCTGSELGNMFYNVLGGSAGSSITTIHNANYDLFSNIQSTGYWSATEFYWSYNNEYYGWYFGMRDGRQNSSNKASGYYAWAVQSGDVSAVPVPAAAWLFGSGLIGLVGFARRKK